MAGTIFLPAPRYIPQEKEKLMAHWLIAGASRGIGLEMARQLALRGETITASLRDSSAHEPLTAALAPIAKRGRIVTFDTRDEASLRAVAAQIEEPVDVLVANAGAYGPMRQSATDMDFDGALDLLSTNTLGPLRVAQAFLPLVRRGDNPRIALMSSRLGSMAVGGTFNVAYRTSKAGLNRIAQCLAADLKPQGVSVIALHPGWVRTDMGGAGADLSVDESAAGVIAVCAGLTLADTGRFLDYRGQDLPW
jgi:NAD(P)-dependent dehydrogenase (short-subunit alcohol dehydrogenase family)